MRQVAFEAGFGESDHNAKADREISRRESKKFKRKGAAPEE
jgi:hypothetical protein